MARRAVGLMRETYSTWERRAPLSPCNVQSLVGRGISVYFQPSNRRAFADSEYIDAGAVPSETLDEADICIGVKQVANGKILPEKTYIFFSHVIKGQPENMPLLGEMMEKKTDLIDYECMTVDGQKKSPRYIAFGEYAGRAGMINTFRGLGERLLQKGFNNPFINLGSSYMYPSLERAKEAVKEVGDRFAEGTHSGVVYPLTCVFTGGGKVGQGAMEIFELVPHEWVQPGDLSEVAKSGDPRKIYGSQLDIKDFTARHEGGKWSLEEYHNSPDKYVSTFHETILPYSSIVMNTMFWDTTFPRLITKNQMTREYESARSKLLVVGDVTCDVGGSIEFLEKSTSIEEPFFLWDPVDQVISLDRSKDGVLMLGVDILPSEFPCEATNHFGNLLEPLLAEMACSDELDERLNGATILRKGELQTNFDYLEKLRHAAPMHTDKWPVLELRGHLFDSGLINKIFDLLDLFNYEYNVKRLHLRPNQGFTPNPSKVEVEIDPKSGDLDELRRLVESQIDKAPMAKATYHLA